MRKHKTFDDVILELEEIESTNQPLQYDFARYLATHPTIKRLWVEDTFDLKRLENANY